MPSEKTVKFVADGKEIEVQEGTSLLKACLDNEIYIPNLCYLESLENPPASCRLCFVEIEGQETPVTSCNTEVIDGMVVKTDTPPVRRLQRTALELLMSVHHVDCAHCPANKKCDLQQIARFLKISLKPKRLDHSLKEPDIYEDHPVLNYYPNRCVLCGRCIHTCLAKNGQSLIAFAKRGFSTLISFYGDKFQPDLACEECLACIDICPVSAITTKTVK
jgi:bidirectional [NiFe] hydrogenase diaphorase subunit